MNQPLISELKTKVLVDSELYCEIFLGRNKLLSPFLAEKFLNYVNSRQVRFYITDLCLLKLTSLIREEAKKKFSVGEKQIIREIIRFSAGISIRVPERAIQLASQYIDQGSVRSLDKLEAAFELTCAREMNIGAIVSESAHRYKGLNQSGLIILRFQDLDKRVYLDNLLNLTNPRVKIVGADLRGLNLVGLNLTGADIRCSDLSTSNLSRSIIAYSKLHSSNISDSNLFRINLMHSILWDVRFTKSNLEKSNLSCADLSGANLSSSNLCCTNLWGAILNDANLQGADLRGADLTRAQMNNTILLGAKLGNNIGLSKETKRDFQNRGALFANSKLKCNT
jgi:uncharacterized protein YjbI with pentapeptide repeats